MRHHTVRGTASLITATAATILIVLALAGCAVIGASPTSSAQASATPSAPPRSDSPTPDPSEEPADPDVNHVATGLAVVRPPSADSPLTEVFVVRRDGSLRQVTGLAADDRMGGALPVWSPDGSMIAFGPSFLGSNAFPAQLLVNADGTGQRLVHQFDVEEFSRASWSSDGRFMVFADATPPGDRRIWLADVTTGQVTRIGTGSSPNWVAGDAQIGFMSGVTGLVPGQPQALTMVAFVMDRDDLQPREFARADNAFWSPDGSAVLLEQDGVLSLADADGSNRRVMGEGGLASWSPDGQRFAYLSGSDDSGRSLIAVMDRDGTEIWSGVAGSAPAWSSDGSRLAVEVSYPSPVVRVLDATTGEQLWETEGEHPAWRP